MKRISILIAMVLGLAAAGNPQPGVFVSSGEGGMSAGKVAPARASLALPDAPSASSFAGNARERLYRENGMYALLWRRVPAGDLLWQAAAETAPSRRDPALLPAERDRHLVRLGWRP